MRRQERERSGPVRPRRIEVLAAVAAALVAAGIASASSEPGTPAAHRDADDARGPLDLAAVSFDQHLRQATLSVHSHERLPPMRLLSRHPRRIDGTGRHLCLVVDGASASHRMLCPGGRSRKGRIEVGVSRVFENGYTDPRGSFGADLERASKHSLRLRFPLAGAGLEPGAFSWRLISGWNGVRCGGPAAGPDGPRGPAVPGLPSLPRGSDHDTADRSHDRCFDRIPDKHGFVLQVHELVKAGCERPGDDVFTNGSRKRKQVALTFDDGPSDYTAAILHILDEHGAKATFFELGDQIHGREAIVRKVLEQGNELANHSMHHEQYASRSSMRETSSLIAHASGFTPCLYRPPYGLMNGQVATDAKRESMASALWDIDTNDWGLPGSDAIYQRATAATNGSIVLMHDGGGPRQQTVEALPHVIDKLRSRGFRLVTVTKLMGGHFRFREAH